jgi:hypothetical protein
LALGAKTGSGHSAESNHARPCFTTGDGASALSRRAVLS